MNSERVPPTQPAGTQPTRRPSITFYNHGGIVVTDRYLVADQYRYDLAELGDLRQARGSRHPGVMVAMVTAVAEAAFVGPIIGLTHTPVSWLAALIALAIPCVVGIYCARRWPAHFELLADFRGRQIVVFATGNEREFGQVSRAVRRAVEAGTGRYGR
jgi:hypothetical protein